MTTLVLGTPSSLTSHLVRLVLESGRTAAVLSVGGKIGGLPPGVREVEGDPAAIDFGLVGAAYEALVREVKRVIVAIPPERVASPDVERSRAVRVASEIVEFVRAGGAAEGVAYLSSLLVFGDAKGPVTEGEFQVGQEFSGPDEESLAVSERIVRRVSPLVPLGILRIGTLVGDTTAGVLEPDCGFAEILRRVEQSSGVSEVSFSGLPLRLETTNRAALALFRLSERRETMTLHLVDQRAPTDRELLTYLGTLYGREFREPLSSARGRRAQAAIFDLRAPERRTLSGWGLSFYRTEAERFIGDLLDPDWKKVVQSFVVTTREPVV